MTEHIKAVGSIAKKGYETLIQTLSLCLGAVAIAALGIAASRFAQGTVTAEISGFRLLTPTWFWPVGAAVAIFGLIVLTVSSYRSKSFGKYVIGLFVMGFIPAVLYYLIIGSVETIGTVELANVMGVLFVAAPWVMLAGIYFDIEKPINQA
jgi:hypothetical protein